MSTGWDHIEKNAVKFPEKLQDDEYRDTLKTVFTNDGKLHFFGEKGVDPTNPNWHETTLVGSFLSTYDLTNKKWLPLKNIAPFDKDLKHRDFIFAVEDQIFLFVYSKCGGYLKLFQWKNDNWNLEIKIDDTCCKAALNKKCSESIESLEFNFLPTTDGFYAAYEQESVVHVVRLMVNLGSASGTTSAKCVEVAKWDISESFRVGGHLTSMAFSIDHRKIFLWGGEQGCGFWWKPEKVHFAQLEPGKVVDVKLLPDLAVQLKPPYAYGGPHRTLQWQNTLIMLGGSSAVGLSQLKDNPEIWAFDLSKNQFRKLNLSMPTDFPLYRCSFAVDYGKGDVYVCDKVKGIYKSNVKNL